MPMAQTARYWMVEDLEHLPHDGNRYEVIDGELLVTPAPHLDHQEAIARLYLLLAPYVEREGFGHVVFAPADVTFSPRRGVQPDLFIMPLADGRRQPRARRVAARRHPRGCHRMTSLGWDEIIVASFAHVAQTQRPSQSPTGVP